MPINCVRCRGMQVEHDRKRPMTLNAFRFVGKVNGDIFPAQLPVSESARRADIDRVAHPRGLSEKRDPRLGTITKIASAGGVRLRFVA